MKENNVKDCEGGSRKKVNKYMIPNDNLDMLKLLSVPLILFEAKSRIKCRRIL